MIAFWSQYIYIILNNKKKQKPNNNNNKKKVAHWKKTVPFRPAFGEKKQNKTKHRNIKRKLFNERKSKCMSMRRHRASLFVEQSVFYLADLNKKKTSN